MGGGGMLRLWWWDMVEVDRMVGYMWNVACGSGWFEVVMNMMVVGGELVVVVFGGLGYMVVERCR